MNLKDYFQILELEPSASLAEIKTAYRRLAQMYHPDKTANDPYATARFSDIKEAYETLTNPWKKDIYLQQRWYVQSTGRKKRASTIDPVSVLKDSLELERYVSHLDVHRLDKEGLYEYIAGIINDETLQRLRTFDDKQIKEEIATQLIRCSGLLEPGQFRELSTRILQLSDSDHTRQAITNQQARLQQESAWSRYQPWVVLAITLVACVIMYWLAR